MQGFKDLVERCYSDKTFQLEHKRNADKLQQIRHLGCLRLSGILASNPDIITRIEDRIGQLHVDDLEKRKSNAKCLLAEETSFVILFSGKNLLKIVLILKDIHQCSKGMPELKNDWVFSDILREAMVGMCHVEQKSLRKILDNWTDIQPVIDKFKPI